jgi:colanic acid/amylovoran biosynthesis glycosyltransferase
LTSHFQDEGFRPVILGNLLSPVRGKLDDLQFKYIRRLSRGGSRAILKRIESDNIKILHFHYLVDARYYLQVIKKAGIPALVSGYGWDVSYFPREFKGLGLRYLKPLFKYVDFFLAMSKDMQKDLLKLGCPEDKILVHYHGINTRRFDHTHRRYGNEKPLTILFCGRLTAKKGPHILLDAIRHIQVNGLSHREFRVRIVGDGGLREQLVDFVAKHKLDNIVRFIGYIPHNDSRLLEEYQNADIYVLPSLIVRHKRTGNYDKEGIPGTLMEAGASGLPIVSTHHAGIPEVIESNVNGLLVKERDEKELGQKISDLLNDESLRERLGKAARESIKKLDVRVKTKDLEDIYARLISPKKAELSS